MTESLFSNNYKWIVSGTVRLKHNIKSPVITGTNGSHLKGHRREISVLLSLIVHLSTTKPVSSSETNSMKVTKDGGETGGKEMVIRGNRVTGSEEKKRSKK